MKWITPSAAGLQRIGMRADDFGELVAAGVLERADRQQLVVLARHLAEVAFDELDLVRRPRRSISRAQVGNLPVAVLMPVPSAP